MVYLFIALFGILFYGCKILNEKSQLKEYYKTQEKINQTRELINNRVSADYELQLWAKEYVECGNNYTQICENFGKCFEFVFGDNWQNILVIPNNQRISYSYYLPSQHIYWVYHLLLASRGKIDNMRVSSGFGVGGLEDKDINLKFAECIERCLADNGTNVNLVLELDNLCAGVKRTPKDICGGYIKIKEFCNYPTHKLW